MLPITRGIKPEPLDPAIQIHLDARLIAVAGGKNDSILLGIDLKDRPDRRIDFGVHQHDVFAVLKRLKHDMRTELDRSGHLADHVDKPRARQEERIFRGHWLVRADRVVELLLRVGNDDILVPGIFIDVDRPLDLAVGDRSDPHARNAVLDLIGQALAHEAGADDANADRLALRLAFLEVRCRRVSRYTLAMARSRAILRFTSGSILASSSNF